MNILRRKLWLMLRVEAWFWFFIYIYIKPLGWDPDGYDVGSEQWRRQDFS
jgi:hypothetical protein